MVRSILRAPQILYRHNLGWMLGHRFLLLEHTGRRTGVSHLTVVEVLHYERGSQTAIVMSGWGRDADWFRNIEANGKAEVTIGRETYVAHHEVLDEQAAADVLAQYESRNRWLLPIIRPVLGNLAGARYDGSEDGRRALVRQLPIVAFRPQPG